MRQRFINYKKPGFRLFRRFGNSKITASPFVDIDQYAGAYELACRLTDAGHRRVGLITIDNPLGYALKREHACRDALLEAGSELPENNILRVDPRTDWTKQAEDFLHQDITAVFLAGDSLHWIFFNLILKLGYKIPANISVAAFDEVRHPRFSNYITCARQPLEKAAECLLDVAIKAADSISIDPEIVYRKVCKKIDYP